MKSITYAGMSFPCSRAGTKLSAYRLEALRAVTNCDLGGLMKLGRPAKKGLRPHCPDPTLRAAIHQAIESWRYGETNLLFVGDECIAAADEARPACRKEPPWLLYKATTVVKGQLDEDEHHTMILAECGKDPSSEAYWRFLKEGTLR